VGAPASSTNKTDRHDITEILLKVALNTITPLNISYVICLVAQKTKNTMDIINFGLISLQMISDSDQTIFNEIHSKY
jgi:hypothetical protein